MSLNWISPARLRSSLEARRHWRSLRAPLLPRRRERPVQLSEVEEAAEKLVIACGPDRTAALQSDLIAKAPKRCLVEQAVSVSATSIFSSSITESASGGSARRSN